MDKGDLKSVAQISQRYSPYKGLIPYTEKDAVYFFGREKETRLIIANLFASPLTLLYGPSGVGKTSVLRAGVASDLTRRLNLKVVIHSEWQGAPLTKLKLVLNVLAGAEGNFDTNLSLQDFVTQYTARLNSRLMIILDQFEEYFLYHPIDDEFTIQLSRTIMRAEVPVSFLISIREDSLAKLDRFEGRIPILFDNYLRLEHLDDTAARSAIVNPVKKYNEIYLSGKEPFQIESELTEEVLQQLKSGRVLLTSVGLGAINRSEAKKIETPYLQLVMTRLWTQEMKMGSRTLHLTTLKKLGGAEKIVKAHLDDVMKRLSSDHQLLASRVFQYLVTPSGTKIALTADDLASFVDAPTPVVNSLLHRLSEKDVRLLRPIESRENAELSYEIFHDVLASPILDWRERWQARHILQRRILILTLLILFIIAVGILGVFLSTLSSSQNGSDLACLLPLLCGAGIFGMIGFFVGTSWTRMR